MITAEDLTDEDGAAAREYFADLQARAAAAGMTLSRTSSGFLLIAGTHSLHTADLKNIATRLKALPRKGP